MNCRMQHGLEMLRMLLDLKLLNMFESPGGGLLPGGTNVTSGPAGVIVLGFDFISMLVVLLSFSL